MEVLRLIYLALSHFGRLHCCQPPGETHARENEAHGHRPPVQSSDTVMQSNLAQASPMCSREKLSRRGSLIGSVGPIATPHDGRRLDDTYRAT